MQLNSNKIFTKYLGNKNANKVCQKHERMFTSK